MNNDNFDDLNFVAGGVELPDEYVRDDIFDVQDMVISDELDRRIVRLTMLHHDKLNIKFRNHDLNALNHDTKRQLLNNMYEVLGIKRLADDM